MHDEKSALLPSSSGTSNENSYGSTTTNHCKSVQIVWQHLRAEHQKSGKILINDVFGVAEAGELVALMGPSGAGKTTLLNSLLGRNLKGLQVSGDVIINGRKTSTGQIMDISGYVQQDELFVSTLTVQEHLNVQANLRLVNMNAKQRKQRIEEIIHELGLRKCRNSRIGISGVKKGISGGELKRLSFASELLDNPPLLFCDEPTTGLDSSMAESVVNLMRSLASSGHTIICTIHQPSSAIFGKFDKAMFLASGRLAYFGSPSDSIKVFKSFGYPCPTNYNPADMILDVLSIEPGKVEEGKERVQQICDKFVDSPAGKDLQDRIDRSKFNLDEKKAESFRQMAPLYLQVWSLLKRSTIDNYRNPGLARAKIIQKTVMGLFVGLLYFQTTLNRVGVSNINGSIFYLVSELTYSTLFGILSFLPAEYPLLLLVPILSILSLTGGLYANIGELPVYISWFQYISWFRYGFEAMSINQWVGVEELSEDGCVLPIENNYINLNLAQTNCIRADDIFDQYSFNRGNFVIDIVVMFGCILIFYTIGFTSFNHLDCFEHILASIQIKEMESIEAASRLGSIGQPGNVHGHFVIHLNCFLVANDLGLLFGLLFAMDDAFNDSKATAICRSILAHIGKDGKGKDILISNDLVC
ncbi:ABC transporter domain-containing protein [Aphelenchoides bicaudatus]|nr:ABC transporter domain-containing protein [Aphelenchoides bicaudatus]